MKNIENKLKTIRVSEQITLKQIELADSMDIFNTIDSQRDYLGEWLPFVAYTKSIDDSRAFIQSILNVPIENREYTFVIHFNNIFAGIVGFKGTDKLNKKTEIGYWLSEHFQKKGIMTESVKALIAFAFNDLNMNRIQIKCAVGNIPSKNIPKKLGFICEGIERDGELLSDGKYTDLKVYSKLKKD